MAKRSAFLVAAPICLRLKEHCYELSVRIIEGPAAMLDRTVKIPFSADQLNRIAEREPTELLSVLYLDAPPQQKEETPKS